MNENDFEAWLVQKHSNRNTVKTYLADAKRVESHNEDFDKPMRGAVSPKPQFQTSWRKCSASGQRRSAREAARDSEHQSGSTANTEMPVRRRRRNESAAATRAAPSLPGTAKR